MTSREEFRENGVVFIGNALDAEALTDGLNSLHRGVFRSFDADIHTEKESAAGEGGIRTLGAARLN